MREKSRNADDNAQTELYDAKASLNGCTLFLPTAPGIRVDVFILVYGEQITVKNLNNMSATNGNKDKLRDEN